MTAIRHFRRNHAHDITVAIRNYIELDKKVRQFRADYLSPLTRRLYDEIWQSFTLLHELPGAKGCLEG